MELRFTKMHGCGNDYIYVNCFEQELDSPESLSVRLSDRHFGVGGDGLVLILRSECADAKMRIFNMDGSEAMMCGNAIRCVAKYLYENAIVRRSCMRIDTRSGVKQLDLTIHNGQVSAARVNMGPPELAPERIPARFQGERVVGRPVTIGGMEYAVTCLSMGNPHAVVFVEDVDRFDLSAIGPLFENDPLFPDRVNAEFVEIIAKNRLKMRVWERGSGETLACGTGACASAVAAVLRGFCEKNTDIEVKLPGGELTVHYTDEAVFLTGGCEKAFDGMVQV